MQWIRSISLVRRVTWGFGAVALCSWGTGAVAVASLSAQPGAQWAVGGCAAATGVLAGVLGWLARSSIKDSVEDTVQCVIRIAGGDLETKIESPGKDEISWLRHELNSMRKKLRTMVVEVRRTVDSVNTAAQEIANGNLDLSGRTEQQASALQGASGAMQQLSGNVRHNADSTLEASSLVAQSRNEAEQGSQVMQQAVERMDGILQSARRIGDIVGVIDGIAFQTNILALNAAVEAARAGEQGRGFAVVASEVRTLAQRSSTAAREIKSLIGDSTAQVESGSQLIHDAGRTMHALSESVARVSQLIGDITGASQSQSADIGQVSDTVQQLDHMTQQNAALVEQMSATALALREQAGRLNDSVGAFRVVA